MKKLPKNILLVYPEVPKNTYWSFKYALKFIKKKSSMPPLGLITVAALFPENYHLKLVDMNIEPLEDEDVLWADAVFVSAMIVQKQSAALVIETCKRLKTVIVAGGPYPTSSREEMPGVDHFVLGEVENIFHEFLSDFEKGTARRVYHNSEPPDISETVTPRFDLLNLNAYASMSVQYSRGCPFRCEFCDIWKVYGNRPRLKSTDNVIKELDTLFALGYRGALFIVDDNFIGNKKRVKNELLPALGKWQKSHDFAFRLFTEASINIASDTDLLNGMQKAAFNEVFIGIETPSASALKETRKIHNLKTDLLEAVQTVQKYGIEVMAGFILGFDSDTDDIFDQQVAFIQKAGIPQAMVGLLTALPGTDLYNRMEKENRIEFETTGNNTHGMMTNFKTKMNHHQLKTGYQQVLSSIYDYNLKNYFSRCTTFMSNLEMTSHYQRKIGFSEIKMLFKSVFFQPFKPYGIQYVKFLVYNFFKKPEIFGEIIKFAIIGHHFHTITQETLKIEKVSSELDEGYSDFFAKITKHSREIQIKSKKAFNVPAELWEKKKNLLDNAKKRIDKIHVDFRDEISIKYTEVSGKIINLLKAYENDLRKAGLI